MKILYNDATKKFAVNTKSQSYVFMVDSNGILRNLYWGKRIEGFSDIPLEIETYHRGYSENYPFKEEYNCRGSKNYLEPCLMCDFADGVSDVRLRYQSHIINEGEDKSELIVTMKDEYYPLTVDLYYIVYKDLDLISKKAVMINNGEEKIVLNKFKSGCAYPEREKNCRIMYFSGQWSAEYEKKYVDLHQGMFTISNHRGTSSGPHFVPMVALDNGNATETDGNVWYGTLHWSGNFRIDCEMDCMEQVVISAGVNDFDCNIELNKGDNYETPLFTIGFSDGGYEKMTETLYDFQYNHLVSRGNINKLTPVLYNSWFPYVMNVNEKNCLGIVDKLHDMGIELFVIDDGWFKGRVDITGGLGDWEVDRNKFPNGLKPIADKLHSNGMLFGLWIELEMINLKSDLYKKHPEWVLSFPTRSKTQFRMQNVLNFARNDVLEFAWEVLDRTIRENDLDYVKWDMNSYLAEIGDEEWVGNKKEIVVKYINNLYELLRRMKEKYPSLIFENCAHGGARADFGMLPYCDRINPSDNCDPADVLRIYEGFSTIFLPKLAGGAGTLPPSPTYYTQRSIPIQFRGHLGMMRSFSVGCNLFEVSDEEVAEIKKYIAEYKEIREIIQFGYMYRIFSAFENNYAVWEYISRDRKEAVVFVFAHNMQKFYYPPRAKMRGLDANKKYRVSGLQKFSGNVLEDIIVDGDYLMNHGLSIEPKGDYFSQLIKISEI